MFSPNVKKSFLLSVASLICFSAYADLYQIKKITYEISGSTKEYALRTKVPVDKKKIFSNEDELMTYINDYKKRLENTRAFEKIQVDFSLEESDIDKKENEIKIEDGITSEGENISVEEDEIPREEEKFYFVNLNVSTSDSLHFLLMPYPKYDSNSGFTLKLKTKDSNFFGTLETMSGDLNFAIVSKDETKYDYKFGLDMNFEVPFKLGIFDSVWMNDYNISYTIGKNTPEWNFKTGLELSLPFERFSVKLDFYQSFIRNLDKKLGKHILHPVFQRKIQLGYRRNFKPERRPDESGAFTRTDILNFTDRLDGQFQKRSFGFAHAKFFVQCPKTGFHSGNFRGT